MRRIKITVAYDGTDFHGWQVQPGASTVQHALQEILSGIEGKPVLVAGSGRTDAGVHARGQVAAFTLENGIPPDNLRKAMNRLLPHSIRVLSVEEVAADFHPRFDAVAKTYEYRIFRGEVCDPFVWRYVHHHPYPLDTELMAATAPMLEGEHDFSAFAASDPKEAEGKSKVRRIFSSRIEVSQEWLVYRVRGSGFLKHMVRNIAGFLLETGKGNAGPARMLQMLIPGCAMKAGSRAPAKGLTLVSVEYLIP
jgi:tRNA pseudouridine38-40 synthase